MATKTEKQALKEHLAALLFGTQLLEDAVRKTATDCGCPLPAGRAVAPFWSAESPRGLVPSRRPATIQPLDGGGRVGNRRKCAIKGCGKPSRTKGYCAADYQKLRLLIRTARRPAAWADFAPENSVDDVSLPRGRAGSKALAEQQVTKSKKGGRS